MARQFANGTSVPVDRTRAEINKLLTDWQCAAIGWTDHLAEGRVDCNFAWHHDAALYRVRFAIQVHKEIEDQRNGKWDAVVKRYMRKPSEDETRQRWRSAHRLLLLKLKADLNAAAAGLARVEEIFLPWIVDRNGVTVAEHVLPRLADYAAQLPPGPKP